MKKLTKFVLSVLTGVMALGMTAFASDVTVTDVTAVLYTTTEAELLADTDMSAVVLNKNAMPDNAPILVTGITNNGYFRVDLNGTYYIAGNGLVEGSASIATPAPAATETAPTTTLVQQNKSKYVCVIEEGDKELLANKTTMKFNLTPRADWTNDYYYIYFRDELEKAIGSGKDYHNVELGVVYEPMCRVFKNLMVDFLKAHPEVKNMSFSNYCPTASYSNPNDGTEYCEYSISYDLIHDKYGNIY